MSSVGWGWFRLVEEDWMKDDFKDADFGKFSARRPVRALGEASDDSVDHLDGRISTKVEKGVTQLNVEVPVVIKSLVVRERKRRRAAGLPRASLNSIVADAIQAYLDKA